MTHRLGYHINKLSHISHIHQRLSTFKRYDSLYGHVDHIRVRGGSCHER